MGYQCSGRWEWECVCGGGTDFWPLSGFPLVDPGGGAYYDNTYNGEWGGRFIAKFSGSNLSLVWSTYFGGMIGIGLTV
jgi:hypothetical protein